MRHQPPTLLPEAVQINNEFNAWLACVRKHPLSADEKARLDVNKTNNNKTSAENSGDEDIKAPNMCHVCYDLYQNVSYRFRVTLA